MSGGSPQNPALSSPPESAADGRYIVVARRYRPGTFHDLVGQDQVSQALRNAITMNRVGHAYLFTGARGVGKTSTARIMAKALNCTSGPTPAPCNECDICQSIAVGEDVDVLEIDGASNRGIDEIRQLRSNVNIRPSRARFKIYIIDEVHMLTTAAFNALLKTLEEPPEHVKFVFCTTDPEKIPITVLSRCQRFDFPPVETSSIAERLKFIVANEGVEADDDALYLLARRASGSLRDSQSLLEQLLSFSRQRITVDEVHRLLGTARGGRLTSVCEHVKARNAAGALAELDAAIAEGVDVGQFAEQLLGHLRDLLAAAVGCGPEFLLHNPPADHTRLQQTARDIGLQSLLAMVQILDQTLTRLRQSTQVRALVEVALVRICCLADLDELPELIARLSAANAVALPAAQKKKPLIAEPDPSEVDSGPADFTKSPVAEPIEPPISIQQGPADRAPVAEAAPQQESSAGPRPTSPAVADPPAWPLDAHGGTPEIGEVDGVGAVSRDVCGSQAAASLEFLQLVPTEIESRAFLPAGTTDRRLPESETQSETQSGGPVAESGRPVTEADAIAIWRQTLASLEDITADFAKAYDSVAISAPNRLVVRFTSRYSFKREYCDRPDRKAKIEEVLTRIAGRPMRVDLVELPGVAQPAAERAPPISRVQRMRETERHPLVCRAIELFDAEVVRIHDPRQAVRSAADSGE